MLQPSTSPHMAGPVAPLLLQKGIKATPSLLWISPIPVSTPVPHVRQNRAHHK